MNARQHELHEARNSLLGILLVIGFVALMIANELSFPVRDQLLPLVVIGCMGLSVLIWLAFTVWAMRVN